MKTQFYRMSDNECLKLISKNKVFNSTKEILMIDHQSEWNGGYIPDIGSKTSNKLPIGNQPMLNQTDVAEAYRQAEEATTIITEANGSHKKNCTCDVKDLFAFGCRCGGI